MDQWYNKSYTLQDKIDISQNKIEDLKKIIMK